MSEQTQDTRQERVVTPTRLFGGFVALLILTGACSALRQRTNFDHALAECRRLHSEALREHCITTVYDRLPKEDR